METEWRIDIEKTFPWSKPLFYVRFLSRDRHLPELGFCLGQDLFWSRFFIEVGPFLEVALTWSRSSLE